MVRSGCAQLIKESNSIVIINKLDSDLEALNRNFIVRDGVYKFDDEILREFVEDLKNRMLKYARDYRDSKDGLENTVDSSEAVKNEVEQNLDAIEAESGLNVAKMTFHLSLATMSKSQAEKVINSLSAEYKSKYFK